MIKKENFAGDKLKMTRNLECVRSQRNFPLSQGTKANSVRVNKRLSYEQSP